MNNKPSFHSQSSIHKKLLESACILSYAICIMVMNIGCPLKHLLGIDCPGCGMTRALLCAIQFDFQGAFACHPLFWTVPVLYAYFITNGRLLKNTLANIIVLAIIAVGYGAHFLIRLFVQA